RQQLTDTNSLLPSTHCPVSRSSFRAVEPIRKLATSAPRSVRRIRGLSTTLPTIVTNVSFTVTSVCPLRQPGDDDNGAGAARPATDPDQRLWTAADAVDGRWEMSARCATRRAHPAGHPDPA